MRTNQQGIDPFGCQVISTNRKLQEHRRKERKRCFAIKARMIYALKGHILSEQKNLWNICKWQDLQVHLKHKQGKMFSNNDWSGRGKHQGSHQEERISQGGRESQGLISRLTICMMLAQRQKPTHPLNWSGPTSARQGTVTGMPQTGWKSHKKQRLPRREQQHGTASHGGGLTAFAEVVIGNRGACRMDR